MSKHMRCFKQTQEWKERQLFSYLPDKRLLQAAGYTELSMGHYKHQVGGLSLYRITMLSQSGLFLFYCDEHLVEAKVVESDEEFMRLLIAFDFPPY